MNTGIFIGLGGNTGSSHKAFDTAIGFLQNKGIRVLRESQRYISSPMYYKEQSDFLNSVIEVCTDLEPLSLLKACKECEKYIGREKTFRNGPRVIDLDILIYNDNIIQGAILTIPHTGIIERDFVIFPLNDLDPNIIVQNQKVGEIIKRFSKSDITVVI